MIEGNGRDRGMTGCKNKKGGQHRYRAGGGDNPSPLYVYDRDLRQYCKARKMPESGRVCEGRGKGEVWRGTTRLGESDCRDILRITLVSE